jgi:hypothetical protein
MGLDMYLHGNKYASKNDWKAYEALPDNEQDFNNIPMTAEFKAVADAIGISDYVAPDGVGLSVEFIAGYWRKANAVHQWFVNEIGDGVDECQSMYVERSKLSELRDLCNQVLDNKSLATELLPPQAGFFFGSTEIDEWYLRDLEETVKIIDRCLAMPDEISFSYQASW